MLGQEKKYFLNNIYVINKYEYINWVQQSNEDLEFKKIRIFTLHTNT